MRKIPLLIKGISSNLIFTTILFISAGRIDYVPGWIFLSVNLVCTLLNYLTIRKNPELITERSKIGEGIKSWDKKILGLSAFTYLLIIVTAGIDSGRYNFHSSVNRSTIMAGVLLMLAGQFLFLTARSQNPFFSNVARIQKERGQIVCDRGLYKVIRHPGYLGMIFSLAAIPMITGSLWSVYPTLGAIILLIVRTIPEDKMLHQELGGYSEYSQKTRFKLLLFIW